MIQLDSNRSDLLKILEEIFRPPIPLHWDCGGFDTHWSFSVSNGIALLRVDLEGIDTDEFETYEWELSLRG